LAEIIAIARNTFREAIRDRILYGFLFFAVALILFSIVIGQLSYHEEVRTIIDIGLAGISLFSVLMAIFLGITLLHKEIEKRTLYTILSKPISRTTYMVGKFLGLAATMIFLIVLMAVVWIGVLTTQGGGPTAGIFAALLLITCETIVVVSMALFFTSFSSPFLSGLFCLGVFFAGRNAEMITVLAQRKSMASSAPFLEALSKVVPNLYLFYPSGKIVEGSWASVHTQLVSSGYLVTALGYGAAYTVFFLLVSIVLLHRRDLI
jgi:ABC-type transport system involved in multi-copper enzyme maturation permease subunit